MHSQSKLNCEAVGEPQWVKYINCGVCGAGIFDWITVKCESCQGSLQFGTTKTFPSSFEATYDYLQWNISLVATPTYRNRKISLGRYVDLSSLDTALFINIDSIAGVPFSDIASAHDNKKHVDLA